MKKSNYIVFLYLKVFSHFVCSLQIANFTTQEKEERLVIELTEPLEQDQEYHLSITYHGDISTDLSGFYRSEFKDPTGAQR